MWLTERDKQTVFLVAEVGALTAKQIQIGAIHSLQSDSRCQRRLTELVRHKYLAVLPRKSFEQAVYVVNGTAVHGVRLLSECLGDEQATAYLRRKNRGNLDHLLAVNAIFVRVLRACHALGYTLKCWQRPHELVVPLQDFRLIPDSYFQIIRVINNEVKTAGFALEIERTSRETQVLRSKLIKYRTLFYGDTPKEDAAGKYATIFGTKSLRVLIVFASASVGYDKLRMNKGAKAAKQLGLPLAHFAPLAQIQELPPSGILTQPIWHSPRSEEALALFPTGTSGYGSD